MTSLALLPSASFAADTSRRDTVLGTGRGPPRGDTRQLGEHGLEVRDLFDPTANSTASIGWAGTDPIGAASPVPTHTANSANAP